MLFFFYAVHCSSSSTDTSIPDNLDEENVNPQHSDSVSSEWNVQEVEEHLHIALTLGLPSLPTIREVYSSYLQQRTYLCPTMENPNATSWVGVWQSYCVSDTGYTYEGQALYSEDIFDQNMYLYQNMVASFFLESPQGETFLGGGEFESLWQEESEGRFFWEARIGGTYRYSEADDWLLDGETSLFWTAYGSNSLEEFHINGGVGYNAIEPHLYIFFEDVILDSDHIEGVLFLRDPTSYWWKISIQSDGATCDMVFFDNVEKGQICVGDSLRSLLQKWYEEMREYVDYDVFEQQESP